MPCWTNGSVTMNKARSFSGLLHTVALGNTVSSCATIQSKVQSDAVESSYLWVLELSYSTTVNPIVGSQKQRHATDVGRSVARSKLHE